MKFREHIKKDGQRRAGETGNSIRFCYICSLEFRDTNPRLTGSAVLGQQTHLPSKKSLPLILNGLAGVACWSFVPMRLCAGGMPRYFV